VWPRRAGSRDRALQPALLRLRPIEKQDNDGLLTDLETAVEAMKNVPWTELQKMKGNAGLLEKIDDSEELLRSLRKALKSA